ncbi:MAG: MogA/MoaB family molybdenum cofactor biosynthesis protein [Gemmatimonadota bacterium]
MTPIRIAIVVVSDGVARGEREDTSGRAIAEWAAARLHQVVERSVQADLRAAIARELTRMVDENGVDVILTTGGTGLTARDVTPEATRDVIEREAPGIAEAIRLEGARNTPYTWLSRAIAGTRGSTLIINLPGSEAGVRDGLAVLDRILAHAVQLTRGVETSKHG